MKNSKLFIVGVTLTAILAIGTTNAQNKIPPKSNPQQANPNQDNGVALPPVEEHGTIDNSGQPVLKGNKKPQQPVTGDSEIDPSGYASPVNLENAKRGLFLDPFYATNRGNLPEIAWQFHDPRSPSNTFPGMIQVKVGNEWLDGKSRGWVEGDGTYIETNKGLFKFDGNKVSKATYGLPADELRLYDGFGLMSGKWVYSGRKPSGYTTPTNVAAGSGNETTKTTTGGGGVAKYTPCTIVAKDANQRVSVDKAKRPFILTIDGTPHTVIRGLPSPRTLPKGASTADAVNWFDTQADMQVWLEKAGQDVYNVYAVRKGGNGKIVSRQPPQGKISLGMYDLSAFEGQAAGKPK